MSIQSALTLNHVRPLLEHDIPMSICTAILDGATTQGSRVLACYIDECHLAVLNGDESEKQRVCAPQQNASLQLFDPRCNMSVQIHTRFQHCETSGSVMDRFKVRVEAARLACWRAASAAARCRKDFSRLDRASG